MTTQQAKLIVDENGLPKTLYTYHKNGNSYEVEVIKEAYDCGSHITYTVRRDGQVIQKYLKNTFVFNSVQDVHTYLVLEGLL